MKRLAAFGVIGACILLAACQKTGTLGTGRYAVADAEYSSQNYSMEREYHSDGRFAERHIIDHCLLMEMKGKWIQAGANLTLTYAQSRNRPTCHDSLPVWANDSAQLHIPLRNIQGTAYESLLAASDGKPEKWIKWYKAD